MSDDTSPHQPTSFDVAQRAGVSQSTVSLVLGGKSTGRVGKPTQDAVLQAAAELGYQPQSAARALRLGRSQAIALVVPDVSNPYFASVLQGTEQAARKQGYSVVLVSMYKHPDWSRLIAEALAARAVDGILFYTLGPPASLDREHLSQRAVMVDGITAGMPTLQLDIASGAYAAMTHLLNLGHTNIAHLAAALDVETFQVRQRAYLRALTSAGISINTEYLVRTQFTIEDAQAKASRLLELPQPPSAIFCDSDLLAIGVYKAAKARGLSIPRDLSVTGFDDSMVARILEPELTTVAIPTMTLGERAISLLLALLQGDQPAAQPAIPLQFVIRNSTAAPGA